MNDTELDLQQVYAEASRLRAEAFSRTIVAAARFLARPFRRGAEQAA